MCSFLVLNYILKNYKDVNKYQKYRGPDSTNDLFFKNFTFVHNLLHVTGKMTMQPFFDEENELVVLFNGEIYNYNEFGKYDSDGYCLIDLYKKYGKDFIKKLDGEFAISLFDFKNDIFLIATDIFGTKPLYYSINEDKLGISSYYSALCLTKSFINIKRLNPNTIMTFKISSLNEISRDIVYEFNFDQFKDTYEDYEKALFKSIIKRTNTASKVFVGLSSGYDSGTICCVLNEIGKEYRTYSIKGKENISILSDRIHINDESFDVYDLHDDQINYELDRLKYKCEKYYYHHSKNMNIMKDLASVGLSIICDNAKKNGSKIMLSGSGADEILCDYAKNGKKIMQHSCFNGVFPDDLSKILNNDPTKTMIWKSFYHGTMRDYLSKDEFISGVHGIEGRYPYLDKEVVQEFLNLKKELKNNAYKGPLEYIMKKYKYPFEEKKNRI